MRPISATCYCVRGKSLPIGGGGRQDGGHAEIPVLRLIFLMLALLLAAIFTAAQAASFAWLSVLPERASELDALRSKFWIYAAASASFVIIDSVLFVRLVRHIKEANKRKEVR